MSKLREKRKDFINLTINEIILLILFLLLLLTSKLLFDNKNLNELLDKKTEILQENEVNEIRMMEVRKIEKMIEEVKEGNGEFADMKIEQIVSELILAREKYEKIKDKDTEIAKLVDKLKKTEDELKKTSEQKNFYKKKYQTTGADLPPCWPKANDPNPMNADYLYKATINRDGIVLVNTSYDYPHREQDRLKLPLSKVEEGKALSIREFKYQTRAIKEWADKNECRHFVILFDDSGNDKLHYKTMLQAIEGHFYKYADR